MYLIEAYDKYGLQILGNGNGQGFVRATQYKRTLLYKNLPRLAGERVEQYKILKVLNPDRPSVSPVELVETLWIQDLT